MKSIKGDYTVRYIVVLESLLFVPHIQDLTGKAEEVICLLKKGSVIPDIPDR